MSNSLITELNKDIRDAASKQGFKFVRWTHCPDCAEAIAQIEGNHSCVLPWANPVCALLFSKKGSDSVVACSCGYRGKLVITKKEFKESPVCKTDGCRVKIGKTQIEENDGYCYKCRPIKESSQPPAEKKDVGHVPEAKACGCGANLPEGRKKYCYSCRPAHRPSHGRVVM